MAQDNIASKIMNRYFQKFARKIRKKNKVLFVHKVNVFKYVRFSSISILNAKNQNATKLHLSN